MAQKNNSPSTQLIYYVSPSGKIHESSCRHCQPDKEGWQKLDSFLQGFTEGYQPCRLCCPSEAEIKIIQEELTEKSDISTVETENYVISTPEESPQIEETTISATEEIKTTPLKEVVKNTKKNQEKKSEKAKDSANVKQDESEKTKDSVNVKQEKSEKTKDSENVKQEESEKTKDSENVKQEESEKTKDSVNVKQEKSEKTKDSVNVKQDESEKTKDSVNVKQKKSEKTKDSLTVKQEKSEKTKDSKKQGSQEKKPEVEKKRYKILAGNGCHQAIAEIQGILVPPHNEEAPFLLILPDGFQLEATFKNPRLKWLAHNTEVALGAHWFRVYPKMKDDKLISVQIIAWDKGMPSNPRGEETWEFIGVWTAQKNITVQRSMTMEDIRKIAKETGFIKKFKYTFINSFDFAKQKKLWMGYVYKLICRRKGDVLEIKKVIPYACPRIKPEPKNFIKDDNRDNSYNKGDKKDFKPKTFKPKIK
jgi:hypothetical protein